MVPRLMVPMWGRAGFAHTVAALLSVTGCSAQDSGGDGVGPDPNGTGGGAGNPEVYDTEAADQGSDCSGDLIIAADHGHRMTSALYAKAALDAQAWPRPELIRRDDFYAYFAPTTAESGAAFGRYFPSAETDGAGSIEIWLTSPPLAALEPVRLIVVVDESSSMGSELGLAGRSVGMLAQSLGVPGDGLALVEWGDEVTVELAEGANAASLAIAFQDRLDAKSQLAGAPSFSELRPVVRDLLESEPARAAGSRAHVVLITDGGLGVDEDALSAFREWGSLGIASVVEVHQVAGMPPPPPAARLSSAAHTEGGGLGLYLAVMGDPATDPLAQEILVDRFDTLFRPSSVDGRLQIKGTGIRLAAPSEEFDSPAVDVNDVDSPWRGHGGSTLGRASVTFCGGSFAGALPLDVSRGFDGNGVQPLQVFRFDDLAPTQLDADFVRFRRMQLVDALVDALQSSCATRGTKAMDVAAAVQTELASTQQIQALLGSVDATEHLAALSRVKDWAAAAAAVTACD